MNKKPMIQLFHCTLGTMYFIVQLYNAMLAQLLVYTIAILIHLKYINFHNIVTVVTLYKT